MKRKLVIMPKLLDIETVILKHKPQFPYKIDGFKYIIHYLVLKTIENKNKLENKYKIEDTFYVPFNSKISKSIIYNYHEYLQYLRKRRIIKVDPSYQVDKKSKSYALVSEYSNRGFIADYIFDEVIIDNINSPKLNTILHLDEKIPIDIKNDNKIIMSGLTNYLSDLQIDNSCVNNKINSLYAKQKTGILDSSNKKSDKNKMIINLENKLLLYKHSIDDINNKYHSPIRDNTGYRFHSVLTNLKSDFRQCLSYKGIPLVNIDIVNAQPYLFIRLLEKDFYQDKVNDSKKIHISDINNNNINNIYNINNNIIYNNILPLLMCVSKRGGKVPDSEYDKYRNVVISGEFYEYLYSRINNQDSLQPLNKDDRKEMKSIVYTALFSDNDINSGYIKQNREKFEKVFPEVYKVMSMIKSDNHATLAVILQRIESHIILNRIVKRILTEEPSIPIFTIHDSILTTPEHKEYLKSIMSQEICDAIGVNPCLKEEILLS